MTGHMVVILVGVIGTIIVLGVVTQMIEGAGRGWRDLGAHYPAQGVAPDATRGEAMIRIGRTLGELATAPGCLWLLMPWTWFRGARQVRYAVDDEYLHLETEGGRLVPRASMSIPWGSVDVGERLATHIGEHVVLRIGETVVLFPSTAIGRELEVRAALEADMNEEPEGDGVDWTEDDRWAP